MLACVWKITVEHWLGLYTFWNIRIAWWFCVIYLVIIKTRGMSTSSINMYSLYINNCPTRCNTKHFIYYSENYADSPYKCHIVKFLEPFKFTFISARTSAQRNVVDVNYTFYVYGSMHRWSVLINAQRDATQSSLFIILQVHSACFRCQSHPPSGVHKTVTTASGTGHIFCAATSLQRGQTAAWPRWREVAAQHFFAPRYAQKWM